MSFMSRPIGSKVRDIDADLEDANGLASPERVVSEDDMKGVYRAEKRGTPCGRATQEA